MPKTVHTKTLRKKFTEEYVPGKNKKITALAPHGGEIETGTDKQAKKVAEELNCRAWVCRGKVKYGNAFDEFHITSTKIKKENFSHLDDIVENPATHSVAFHCYNNSGFTIGGRISEHFKELFASILEKELDIDAKVVSGGKYGGVKKSNIVNKSSVKGGLQIEQSGSVRSRYGTEIALFAAYAIEEIV